MIRVTVWCDGSDDLRHPEIAETYPGGIAEYTADYLREDADLSVRVSGFQDADCGLSDRLLRETDVLVLYSHFLNDQVPQDRVEAVCRRVNADGMGIVALHSALWNRMIQELVGKCQYEGYREIGEAERVWNVAQGHPIGKGIPASFTLEHSEMYREPAEFPRPHDVLFLSWYEGGEASRSGLTWVRGEGKVFYFSPGHATYTTMLSPHYHQIVKNGVHWVNRGI